jgi:hypothetical protein
MRYVFILLLMMAFPTLATAGAWPRGKGNGYIDLSFFAYPQDYKTRGITPHVFMEFGINKKMTLTLDGIYRKDHKMFTGVASVVFALPQKDGRYSLAFGMGYGRAVYQYETRDETYEFRDFQRVLIAQTITQHTIPQTVSQYSAHFGTSHGKMWLTADAYMRTFHTSGLVGYKFDVTYGKHISERLSARMQLQYGLFDELEYLNVAPTVNWRLGKHMSLSVGASYDTISGYEAFKFGTVFEF